MNALIAQLPPVRGRLTADAAIGKQTWFGVGGPAEVLFRPADLADTRFGGRVLRTTTAIATILALSACVPNLPDPYVVKDLRVIAIVAEPPEVAPGATKSSVMKSAPAPRLSTALSPSPRPMRGWVGSNSSRAFTVRSAAVCE